MGRFAVTVLLMGAFASVAAAQQPQLTWEGEVNGPTRLVIQGDRVEVMGNSDVNRPNFRFYEALPNRAGEITADVVQGRGSVRVVEQPYRDNNFRAVVALNPRGRNEFMRVNLFWQGGGYGRDRGVFNDDQSVYGRNRGVRNRRGDAGGGSLNWSGQVDQEAIIEIRGRQVVERSVRGRPVNRQDVNMTGPLPRVDTDVNIADARGRGRIELVQQPNASNGYVAAVRIRDDENGAGDYSFTLNWGDQYGYQTGNTGVFGSTDPNYDRNDNVFGTRSRTGSGTILFSGRIDGRVRVIVQGGRYSIETVSGQPPRNVRVDFAAPLPAVPVDVNIDRRHGRDEVNVIQRPDSSNGYRLVFEINDDSSGQDDYEVEIRW
jgi:hypothetical protein